MNNNEIELLIKEKELQISKLYEQIAELKQQLKKWIYVKFLDTFFGKMCSHRI